MTDKNGWIKLHRKIKDNWLWENDKPFDKRSAWIDILLMVNHEKNKILFDNELIEVKPGERITSERKLADRWGWSRTKVRNFLELLEKDDMIKVEKTTKKTSLKVVNWEKYQKEETGEKTTKKPGGNQTDTSEVPPGNTNKNVKNDKECFKNDKESNNIIPAEEVKKIYNSLPSYWTSLFKDYIDIYRSKNKTGKITDNRHMKLLKEINQIFQNMKFEFDKQSYELTEEIFEKGLNIMIEKNVDNINYAKKVWISEIENEDSEEELEDTFTAEEVQEFVDKNL